MLYNQLKAQGYKSPQLCNLQPNSASQIFDSNPTKSTATTLVYKTGIPMQIATSLKGTPGRLRLVDVDLDGFPDIILTLVNSGLSTNTYLYSNVDDKERQGLRTFKQSDRLKSLLGVDDALLVTFMDLDEDGRIDYLVQISQKGVPSLRLIYNNMISDSFFVKALMLNSKLEKSDNIYGDTSMGVSYRFVVTDLEDNKYVLVGSQSS